MRLVCESCHRYWKLPRGRRRCSTCPACHRQRIKASWDHRRMASRMRRAVMEKVSELGAAKAPVNLEKLMADVEAVSARAIQAAKLASSNIK